MISSNLLISTVSRLVTRDNSVGRRGNFALNLLTWQIIATLGETCYWQRRDVTTAATGAFIERPPISREFDNALNEKSMR